MSSSTNCILLDISESGARLHTPNAAMLPNAFLLVFKDGLQKWCKVTRHNENEVGVRFLKAKRTAPAQSENRKKPRRALKRSVQAVTVNDSRLAVDCTLLDISESGGRLQTTQAASLPDEFVLVLHDDLRKWCRVVRRAKDEVGVRFVKVPQDTAAA